MTAANEQAVVAAQKARAEFEAIAELGRQTYTAALAAEDVVGPLRDDQRATWEIPWGTPGWLQSIHDPAQEWKTKYLDPSALAHGLGTAYQAARPGTDPLRHLPPWLHTQRTKLVPAGRGLGRGLGVVGLVFDAYTAIFGSQYGDGVRGRVDHGVALVSVGAPVVGVTTGLAATPPGMVALGAISAGTAAWQIGNWIYDQHNSDQESIAEFMVGK